MARSTKKTGLILPREADMPKDKGFKKCVFKTDSQILVRACKKDEGRSYLRTIVRECIELFKHFDEVLLCFAHRSANEAAHTLARVAYFMSDFHKLHVNAPEFLYLVISYEVV